MKHAEYRDTLFAGVDLVHQDIRQRSYDPFSCPERAARATRIRKIAQDFRCLADASADTRRGRGVSLIDIFVDRQKM